LTLLYISLSSQQPQHDIDTLQGCLHGFHARFSHDGLSLNPFRFYAVLYLSTAAVIHASFVCQRLGIEIELSDSVITQGVNNAWHTSDLQQSYLSLL
jgi:hypothetical protein